LRNASYVHHLICFGRVDAWSRRAEAHGDQARRGDAEAARENYLPGKYPHGAAGDGDDFGIKPVNHHDRKRLKRND
jgi:hypothetical protein